MNLLATNNTITICIYNHFLSFKSELKGINVTMIKALKLLLTSSE